MGQVVSSAKFGLSYDKLAELRNQGILVQPYVRPDDMGLSDVQPGEEVVGAVSNEELVVLYDLTMASREFEVAVRMIQADSYREFADRLAAGEVPPPGQVIGPSTVFASEAAAEAHYRKHKRIGLLHDMLHWAVAERLGQHSYALGFRKGGKVVRMGRRY